MPIAKDVKFQYSNMRGNIVKNAGEPVDDQDLATKSYVDNATPSTTPVESSGDFLVMQVFN